MVDNTVYIRQRNHRIVATIHLFGGVTMVVYYGHVMIAVDYGLTVFLISVLLIVNFVLYF